MEADFSQWDHLTDIFGSMLFIKRYTKITLAFSLPTSSNKDTVVSSLEASLARLLTAIPYLGGKVIYVGRDDTHTGIRKIVPHEGRIPLLVKDYTSTDMPSLEELASRSFPASMLDPDLLNPSIALTWHNQGFEELAPVLILQANFIKGGFLLTIASNHTTMDMTGLGMIIAYLSKACRDSPLSDQEIRLANQDRRTVVPLLEPSYEPGNELDDSFINPSAPRPAPLPPAKWYNFILTPTSLTNLKAAASTQSITPYISTDDAISALFWQRVCAARAHLFPHTYPNTTLIARTVSARAQLGLQGYIGHLVDCVYARLSNITTMTLGDVAATLRALVNDADAIVRHTRAFLTVLDRMDDKSQIISGAQLNLNWDFVVSSYANIKTCELDFGEVLGGRPVAARRTQEGGGAPGCMNIMPADRDGRVAVALCASEDEVEWLKGDAVLGGFAEFVG